MPYQEDSCDSNSVNINNNNNNNSGVMNNNIVSDSGNVQIPPPPPPPQTMGMTKAEIRKSNKPIMEKKRRARINHCLNELKTLILEAMRKDPARHTKLEKADILEMTVKHLQSIQRQQLVMAVSTDPTVIHKFKSGFVDCAEEVNRYIAQMDGLEVPVKQRLMNHLNNCVSGLQQISPFNFGTGFVGGAATLGQHHITQPIPLPQDINNNTNGGRIQMGGNQFIPTRLPTGELALVVPNSNNLPFFSASNFNSAPTIDINASFPRLSAFNAVNKNLTRPVGTSPPLSPISSISSMGDDSSPPSEYNILPNATTPPLQLQSNQPSLFSAFPTPPSCNNSFKNTLQQPHITSTTETPKSNFNQLIPTTVINHQSNLLNVVINSKKRSYPADLTDTIREDKIPKISSSPIKQESNNNNNNDILHENNNLLNQHHNNRPAHSPNENMWRPW